MANSSAIFQRLHTWGATDIVSSVDINNEFNNILTNFTPAMMGGYSINVTQMQVQTSPGGIGSESLAAALSGEIERLRFQLAAIQGTTYWYQTPAASLATLNSALGANAISNRVSSGVAATTGQPAFLIPDGTTNKVTLSTSTAFVYAIQGIQYTISSNVTLAGLATAGVSAAGTVCVVSDTSITAGQSWTQYIGENGSAITIGTTGTTINSLVGKVAGFKNLTSSEYFIARIASNTTLMDCYRGYFQTGASSFATRANVTNGDQLRLMQLTWIYATTAGGLNAVSTNPSYSGTAPSTPANGDYWYDLANSVWKTHNGSSWVIANATLIGVTIQDDTKTVGSRGLDFFGTYNSTNTIELFDSPNDTAFSARSRYLGSQISVYGTSVNANKNYFGWTASGTGLIDSTTLTTGNVYYFYISSSGNTYTSSIAPYNRNQDLLGYYHPSSPYRCVGFGLCSTSGSQTFSDIESFYVSQQNASTSSVTAANSNLLVPYTLYTKENVVLCNASGGAFTQTLPHPSQWKGQRISYFKTDSSVNAVTVQSFGLSVLTTTANISQGQTTVLSMAASAGLSAGIAYLISGAGIPWGTTATWASGTTATLSQSAYFTTTGTNVTFAQPAVGNGILVGTATTVGQFNLILSTQGEGVELYSDGTNVTMMSHPIPSQETYVNGLSVTSSGAGAVKGAAVYDNFYWQRDKSYAVWRYEGKLAAGTTGVGDYQWALPSPINSIDASKTQFLATAFGATYPNGLTSFIGTGIANNAAGAAIYQMYIFTMSATQFKSVLIGVGCWSASAMPLGNAQAFNITARHPVTNWWG